MLTAQIAGSDLCHDEFRKLSGSLCFVILLLLETEIFAKMSKKYRNEQPWVESLLHQTCCVSRRHNKSASPLQGLAMTSTYESWQAVHCGIFSDIFANISVPNKSKITKQRRPDSLRNSSWHTGKSEPAIWVVNMFVNVENKPTQQSFGSLFYIEEWHSYRQVGTGLASKANTWYRGDYHSV